ncbi:uncharacterized protein [Diadema antillarum]|uniref:uncharacterized protein n=1 Tax=Diadema antillarum TaxID=105358 RepID=UPI003A850052
MVSRSNFWEVGSCCESKVWTFSKQGTESWLSSDIQDNEVFSTEVYDIHRRYRPNDAHGAVFIATKKDLIASRVIELETNCEILWCKIEITGTKTLYIASYYKPQEGDEASLLELPQSLSRLNMSHPCIVGGDFNLPGWDWLNQRVKECGHHALHHKFGEVLDDYGLVQLVKEPTRQQNILDLYLVNNPTLVHNVSVVTGISDHDCPLLTLDMNPSRRRQKPRKVPVYSKADWEAFQNQHGQNDEEGNQYGAVKRFWSFIKHNRSDSGGISEPSSKGRNLTDPTEKADALNHQFQTVFTKETPVPCDLLPSNSPYETMPDINITTAGVKKLLDKLNPKKASGPDGITPRVLKELSNTIAPCLCNIFRKSYNLGEIPDDWRHANIVPIFKKGYRADPSNYKPISLTCITCKLMEHILASNIMAHGNHQDILYYHSSMVSHSTDHVSSSCWGW